ncbi:DNA modification methylase [Mycolicibacterium fortuitum]|uniref:DNA modification methylase n=1 Tax=Mycolicibacterium fortuitum TaxID=1766 RepID=UPI000B306EBC|nr:DNA modification methylase [Mycolicibacterium fortuitum]
MTKPQTIGHAGRMAVGELTPFAGNPRRGNVDVIAQSLAASGQYRPIVVNEGTLTGRPSEVLAGNHTLHAARKLGWAEIDVWLVDVDDETAKRIVAADNRTADLGDYDAADLFRLLDSLDDLDGTGYSDVELERMRRDLMPDEPLTDPDDVPDKPEDPISEVGQVWQLGDHRLLVGDSTNADMVLAKLFGDERADCVWTDPPYGVDYVGKTKDALTIRNDGAAGLQDLLGAAFPVVAAVCRPGAPVYVAHADTERVTFETAMRAAGLLVRQNLVWVKNTMVMGRSDYHYQHEPILQAEAPGEEPEDDAGPEHEPILYGFTAGGQGRLGRGGPRWFGDNKQTTVFAYKKPARNGQHPTMKPVGLIAAMLANSCPPRGLVFDPFSGSGSTLIAAHGRGAQARCVELDPRYADVIIRRFEEHTGIVPSLDGREISFVGVV